MRSWAFPQFRRRKPSVEDTLVGGHVPPWPYACEEVDQRRVRMVCLMVFVSKCLSVPCAP